MANEPLQIHLAAKYKSCCLLLQIDRGTIRPQQTFFIHANTGRIENRFAVLSLRKQQDTPARPHRLHGRPDKAVACHGQYDRIGPSAFRHILDCGNRIGGRGVDILI